MALSAAYASIGAVPRLGSGVPLVARAAEIEQLRAALTRALSGSAGAVLVAGDAGVGKTRLLGEFAGVARADGAAVLTGRCLGVGEAGLPYLPFMEVVEQLHAYNPDLVTSRPPLAGLARLGSLGSGSAEADERAYGQLQLFDAVLGALVDLASDRSVVLILEDLHWSDASTRDLVAFLLSRLSTQRLLVIASYRTDDLHRQHPLRPLLAELTRLPDVDRLDLQPFDAVSARAFVRALADDDVADDIVVEVAQRSEGNAFFAEELLAARAVERGVIPTALADVLMSRVEQLHPTTQRVLGAVSVTGRREVRHDILQSVLHLDDDSLDAALREAMQFHVLVPGREGSDTYTFRHALLREAIYADLLPGERVRLHAAFAGLIVERGETGLAAPLAYHSLRSNDLTTALRASVNAAQEAKQVSALGAELRHVEQALELWHAVDDPEAVSGISELGLTRKAAYVAGAAGHPERALAYARAAVPIADLQHDPVISADARRQLAQTLLPNGRWEDAKLTIDEAWQLICDSPPSPERAWVLALRARVADDDPDGRAVAEAAADDARASGSASAEADALVSLAFYDLRAGHDEQACELLERAAERAADAGALDVELRAWFNLAVTRFEQGRLDLAAEVADAGAKRASDTGLTWSTFGLEVRWLRAMVHYARGAWDDAAAAAAPPGEPVSDTISALLAAAAALVQVARGDFTEAHRELQTLRPEWHRDGQIAHLASAASAWMALWQDRPEAATAVIDDGLEWLRKTSGDTWPMGGIRLAALGTAAQADLAKQARQDHDAAAELEAITAGERYADLARRTAELGVPRSAELGPEGRAWLAQAAAEASRLRGEHDPAPWRAVVEAFDYGEVYPQAMARWRLAEVLVAIGQREHAAAELATTLDSAKRLGARPLAEAVRALARRARLSLPGVTPPAATSTLTPREQAVLRLVAQGGTNRSIGAELFISEKTVSVHISRIMAKFEAGSRTEAVAVAYQRGLLEDGS